MAVKRVHREARRGPEREREREKERTFKGTGIICNLWAFSRYAVEQGKLGRLGRFKLQLPVARYYVVIIISSASFIPPFPIHFIHSIHYIHHIHHPLHPAPSLILTHTDPTSTPTRFITKPLRPLPYHPTSTGINFI